MGSVNNESSLIEIKAWQDNPHKLAISYTSNKYDVSERFAIGINSLNGCIGEHFVYLSDVTGV